MMQRRSTIDAGPERTPKIPVNGSSQCASHGACATATTGYRQEGCRHLDPAPVPAFPVQSSEPDARAYLALQVYVASRRVASIRAPAAAGGRGACRWSCLRCGARRPTPVAHPFLAPARSFGSGAAADVADSRLCAAEAGRWRPGRTGGSRADAAASGARALRGGCRAPGRDREDGRGGAVHARILGSLTARGREGTSLSRSRISRAGLVRPGGGMRRRSRTELVASCVTSSPGPSVAAERRRQAAGPGTGSGGGLFYPAVRPVCRARIVSIGGRAVAVIYY